MIFENNPYHMVFMQYKDTTCLSILEALKRVMEIPTSREKRRKQSKIFGDETTNYSDQYEALDEIYNLSQRTMVKQSL